MLGTMPEIAKYMDKTTAAAGAPALATLFYKIMNGEDPDEYIRQTALAYWQTLVISPWDTSESAGNPTHARLFFKELTGIDQHGDMLESWRNKLGKQLETMNTDSALAFLRDCFQRLLHKPRTYHDFFCQRQTLQSGHVMDFPIRHPIAVEFWTLYSTRSGKGSLTLKGREQALLPGSLALIPPGCHCTVSRDTNTDTWEFDWLNVRSRTDWFDLVDWAFSPDDAMVVDLRSFDAESLMHEQMTELQNTPYNPGDINERLCHNIIENLLLRLQRECSVTASSNIADQRTRSAADYVLTRLSETVGLEQIAEHVNLSPGRLNSLFRQHYGTSLMKWRDRMRLQKAKELLEHSTDSVNQIANAVGYEDPLYFSRRFKQRYGVSPRHHRSGLSSGA